MLPRFDRPAPVAAALLLLLAAGGCGEPEPTPIRNVILVVADGMGPQQIGLLEAYAAHAPESTYAGRRTALRTMMDRGETAWVDTSIAGKLVADSAAAASQLATGVPAAPETLGRDEAGRPVDTLLERARRAGKAVGLVTDVRLTHATPAAFVSHREHRSEENAIAVDLLESGADVLLGGGLRHWIAPAAAETPGFRDRYRLPESLALDSRRDDGRNLLEEALNAGYALAFDGDALRAATRPPLLGLFAPSGLRDGIRESRDELPDQPTLAEMTRVAIELLDDDREGFFLMVEAGQIDWAGHANDAGRTLHEMIRLDRALAALERWAHGRDDTLIVVTADHEAGGLALSYSAVGAPASGTPNFDFVDPAALDRLHAQTTSFNALFDALPPGASPAQLVAAVREATGFRLTEAEAARILEDEPNAWHRPGHRELGEARVPRIDELDAFHPYVEDRRPAALARALAEQTGVVWATGTHTHTPVPAIAYGPERATRAFRGWMTQPDVGRALRRVVAEGGAAPGE